MVKWLKFLGQGFVYIVMLMLITFFNMTRQTGEIMVGVSSAALARLGVDYPLLHVWLNYQTNAEPVSRFAITVPFDPLRQTELERFLDHNLVAVIAGVRSINKNGAASVAHINDVSDTDISHVIQAADTELHQVHHHHVAQAALYVPHIVTPAA